ncbi:MAG: PEGA domain-containing protein [Xanthomonadales bacterium]|nr:PEGA domain-containing protein [Xanthomonadales bacterium]
MAEQRRKQPPLAPAEFTPLDEVRGRREWPVSPGMLVLGVIVILAGVVLVYLFSARAVIFQPEPADAEIEVSGLSFNIGNNHLLLRGSHRVEASAPGYRPLETEIVVGDESPQEVELRLEALPGSLQLESTLDEIEVYIDGEVAGLAPGLIENVSRGSHIVEYRKHRYFPLREEIDVEGLGRTQVVQVELEPAWGEMQFTSRPEGADLFVDDELVGQTPLSTEVLETGSLVRLAKRGYKDWERELTVKAGTSEAHPLIEMTVADGILQVSSQPRGASVTVDREFRGIAPLNVALSPLGEHRVELYLEGYQKAVRTVSIEPEQRSSLAVSLTPIIGRIQLSVEPQDAEVLVNGTVRGRGSQVLELTAREHRVVVRKDGYAAQSFKVTPRPDQAQSLEVKLLTETQDYWASRPPRITSPVGTQLLLFRPSESFKLGAPRREPGRRANEAERAVRLERPFYVGTHEITNAQFRMWKGEHSSRAMRGQTLDMDNQPVVNVSWQDAALFCNWLSQREGLPPFYVVQNGVVTGFDIDAHGYRLPTEAEWAYVARITPAGDTLMFPWGTELYLPQQVVANFADQSAVQILTFTLSNYNDGYPVSAPVGSFGANARGLYDLGGNAAEWVSDYYDIRPSRDEELDPVGPETGSRHVIRGSSWAMGSRSELRLSYRDGGDEGRMDTGFRIARYVDAQGVDQ